MARTVDTVHTHTHTCNFKEIKSVRNYVLKRDLSDRKKNTYGLGLFVVKKKT